MLQIQPKNTGDLWVLGHSEALLETDPKRSYKPFGELELYPRASQDQRCGDSLGQMELA